MAKEKGGIVAERSKHATQCPSLSPSTTMTTAPAQKHISSPKIMEAIAKTSISRSPALPAPTNVIQISTNRTSSIVAVTICKIIALITTVVKRKAQAKVRENTVLVTVKTTKRLRIITKGNPTPRASHSKTVEAIATTEPTMVIVLRKATFRTRRTTRSLSSLNKTKIRTPLNRQTTRIR